MRIQHVGCSYYARLNLCSVVGIGAGEAADLTYWELAARQIAAVCNATAEKKPKIIVEKSTVPVKTADAMAAVMAAACKDTNFQVR